VVTIVVCWQSTCEFILVVTMAVLLRSAASPEKAMALTVRTGERARCQSLCVLCLQTQHLVWLFGQRTRRRQLGQMREAIASLKKH
jgi:hypothetical protein